MSRGGARPSTSRSEGHSLGPRDSGWGGQVRGIWGGSSQAPSSWDASPVLCPGLRLPLGLEDVSKYPDLVAELLRRRWTEAEVRGALADNLLRVFEAVEQVRRGPRVHPLLPGPQRAAA